MKIIRIIILLSVLNIFINTAFAETEVYKCGIAIGFPPYQFSSETGRADGIDAEIIKLLAEKMSKEIIFVQEPWDELMSKLFYTNNIDFLCGAEINEERLKNYDFTIPIYNRNAVIFVKENSSIKTMNDLYGKMITGDRHSFVESKMGRDKNKFRLIKTESKEQAFEMLKKGKVEAVIAPLEVGKYIAKQKNMNIRIMEESDPGTPVALMIKKGNIKLKKILNDNLKELIESGKIAKILKKYQ